jgi:hypothetical protein
MIATNLYGDSQYGTFVVFNGLDEVRVTVAVPPFSKLSMPLDLDDVDRLLAVVENAVDPELDLAEFFTSVYHCPPTPAKRAARAFCISAPGLAETLR